MDNHGEIRFYLPVHVDGITFFPQAQESILYYFLSRVDIFHIFLRKKAQARKMTPEEHFETCFGKRLVDMCLFTFQLNENEIYLTIRILFL